jgi:hypothetical protein
MLGVSVETKNSILNGTNYYQLQRQLMKKKNKIKPQTSILKRLSKWWFIILFLGFFFYQVGKQTYVNYKLKHYGMCTKARVYSRNKVGSKGTVDTKYSFEWKNNNYIGSSTSDDKYRETDNFFLTEDDLVIGDTLVVVFLESNPDINRSNSIVEKKCDCDK